MMAIRRKWNPQWQQGPQAGCQLVANLELRLPFPPPGERRGLGDPCPPESSRGCLPVPDHLPEVRLGPPLVALGLDGELCGRARDAVTVALATVETADLPQR